MRRSVFFWLVLSLIPGATTFAQNKPEIHVSSVRVKSGDNVMLTGNGFTPNRTVMSHLLKPNGSEYNPLRLRVNDRGEISHKIDTVMLDIGTFEVWAEDEASKTTSNRLQFTVESSERPR
jgi:hypothetical protein